MYIFRWGGGEGGPTTFYCSHKQKDPELIDIYSDDLTYKYISGNIKRTKKCDHILELAGLGLFCYYCFIDNICKIRLLSLLINYKLIPGLSGYDCKQLPFIFKYFKFVM